jgi:hypothetical protein
MSKVILLKNLKSKLNISDKIEIKKEKYSWGNLRVIYSGISFSVIIHPEHWAKIDNLKSGEKIKFRDETREVWRCEFDGKNLTFFTLYQSPSLNILYITNPTNTLNNLWG